MLTIKEVLLEKEKQILINFLNEYNLEYEEDITYSILVYEENELVATASLSNNIMKDFLVRKEYIGQNITNMMFTHLVSYLHQKDIYHYFVFTTPKNEVIFKSLNMTTIVKTMNTVLLEGGSNILHELSNLKHEFNLSNNKKSALIINANPMTLGHLYLIETASKESEEVIVFVVSEDQSSFPFRDRYSIICEATKHLKNVTILPSLPYVVSRISFPKYFLKEDKLITEEHTLIDVLIYKEYYQKVFNINLRYVGDEPLSVTTNKYNEVMKLYLGNRLRIVKRIESDGEVISASLIRKMIKNNKIDETKKYLPLATYNYLLSDKGKEVIRDIQSKELGRH